MSFFFSFFIISQQRLGILFSQVKNKENEKPRKLYKYDMKLNTYEEFGGYRHKRKLK